MTAETRSNWPFYAGLALRLVVLVVVILGAIELSAWVRQELGIEIMPHNEALAHKMILMGLLVYILLTAIPFVPGAEIGMSLLTVFGAPMAPLVYLATVISLSLSFAVGRCVRPEVTARCLRGFRLTRAADLLDALAATPHKDRAQMLLDMTGNPRLQKLAQHRYGALLVLINVPGNVVIGGGGGLAFAAGLSGIFAPLSFLLTVVIAVLPVPLMIYLLGS